MFGQMGGTGAGADDGSSSSSATTNNIVAPNRPSLNAAASTSGVAVSGANRPGLMGPPTSTNVSGLFKFLLSIFYTVT